MGRFLPFFADLLCVGTGAEPVRCLTIALALLAGCTTATADGAGQPPLVGTQWHLVGFETENPDVAPIRPRPNEAWTLRLDPGGRVAMQLSCNRGTGRWTAPDPRATSGSLVIGPLATTRAACPPSPLARLAADMEQVRSYIILDGRLHLNLPADAGNYVWVPAD